MERIMTCQLCGATFTVTSKKSNAKYCPECRMAIHHSNAYREMVYGRRDRKRKASMARLDQLAREARAHGLSYGYYVALLKGYPIRWEAMNV
ncbi:hypothetical protein [Selenomonas sp. AB3002]|jgi:hypothetical protein|uniref:hypothetical protein n=1 Tax=Selenomonas sp. AB3002 TaxID=1392502 RepID=UPI0004957001